MTPGPGVLSEVPERRPERVEAREEKTSVRMKPRSARGGVTSGEIQRLRSQPSGGLNPWSAAVRDLRVHDAAGNTVRILAMRPMWKAGRAKRMRGCTGREAGTIPDE
jgi:hypothetical protein